MFPINGFMEYGIMALTGAVGMAGMTIWTLASTQTDQSKGISVRTKAEKPDSEAFRYKKAA